ncbi:Phage Mu gp47 related protein [Lactobacillus brevis ATCC 367] [Lactiplantibacillus mudanjiangensis]|nr:Phage Mu gp47 related protein [Lactobacillus brevis ATCC 367] [Lactiplantibacillus mudanjiangensis]
MALDENGYSQLDLATALTQTRGDLQANFSPNIDLSDGTFFGQWAQILAQMMVEVDEKQESVYDAFFIGFANGVSLDRIASNYGLVRKQAKAAEVNLSFIGAAGYVITDGTVFMDSLGNEFYTLEPVQLDVNGAGNTTAASNELGEAYNVGPNSIQMAQLPVEEIEEVNNQASAAGGQDMEYDFDFRKRIMQAALANDSATHNGLTTALMNVDGVTAVKIVENNTMEADSAGNPPKTIHFYVNGGTDDDVGAAIFNHIAAGITTVGQASAVTDDVAGNPHTTYFDRPTQLPIYVQASVNVTSDFNQTEGTDDIKTAIEGYIETLTMGENVIYNQFFSNLYALDGIVSVTLKIGIAADSVAMDNITVSDYQLPVITDDDIEVTYSES